MAEYSALAKARTRLWKPMSPKMKDVPMWALLIGSFGFAGLSPVSSGTVGSLVAAVLYYFIPTLQHLGFLAVACFLVFIPGVVATDVIELKLGEHDPSVVVIDEVLGQWIALFTWTYAGDPIYVVIAFVMFRFFDIFKVWPASLFEKRNGGSAVMLDDAVAGVWANIATHLAMMLYVVVRGQ
ncbi:MAG: phosphatidylglycerophosphatase A [Bacteroidetes bacterium]|nr:phosphatidylglycerophosphatase A [Bacteroidota bacterium]